MNGRLSKKIRRIARRNYTDFFLDMQRAPLKFRLFCIYNILLKKVPKFELTENK